MFAAQANLGLVVDLVGRHLVPAGALPFPEGGPSSRHGVGGVGQRLGVGREGVQVDEQGAYLVGQPDALVQIPTCPFNGRLLVPLSPRYSRH